MGLRDRRSASSGEDVIAMIANGDSAYQQRRFDQARGWYRRAARSGDGAWAPRAMFNLGVLEQEQGRTRQARRWYSAAARSGDLEWAPQAMYNLARLEHVIGNVDEARRWYAEAVASDDAEQTVNAMIGLGGLEREQGRIGEGRREEAIARGQPGLSATAMFNLARLEHREGNLDAARHWYQRAIGTGDPDAAPRARHNLSALGWAAATD